MIDTSIQRAVLQHWRSALMLSASVMLSACVATPGGSSSSQTAESSSSVAISSEASSEQSSSDAPQSSSSIAPSSSSVAPSSSSVAPSSSSVAPSSSSIAASSSSAAACEEPDTTQFDDGEFAYTMGSCTGCHGEAEGSGNGSTAGGFRDPINATKASYDGKTMAQFIVDEMSAYLPASCSGSQQQCAEDIEHYLKIATGAEAAPEANCEESSSSVASSSSMAATSSSAAPAGPSLLTSSGTFANGIEDFTTYFDDAGYASASFAQQEANFTINTATSMAWHVQLVHPLSVVAGEQYTICMDAKAAGSRSISVEVDNGPTEYAGISGGPVQFSLTTSYQSFESTFFADATDTTARLVINMGLDDADVQLDNIAVYAGDSCTGGNTPQSSSSQASSQPVASSSSQGTTSSTSNPGSGDFIIDEDFEGSAAGQVPAGWHANTGYGQIDAGSSAIQVDSSRAHSGSNSVVIKTSNQMAPHFLFKELPSGLNSLYVRAYIYSPAQIGGGSAGGAGDHSHFMGTTATPGGDSGEELRFGPVKRAYLGGFMPKNADSFSNQTPSEFIPANTWTCVEWGLEKNATFDRMYGWVNGDQVLAATEAGHWANGAGGSYINDDSLSTINFGWRKFGAGADISSIWFDDIKVSDSRIGCN